MLKQSLSKITASVNRFLNPNPAFAEQQEKIVAAANQIAERFNWTLVRADQFNSPLWLETPFVELNGMPILYFIDMKRKTGFKSSKSAVVFITTQFNKIMPDFPGQVTFTPNTQQRFAH